MQDTWWASLAFLAGLAAGFQGVYEKFKKRSVQATLTMPGLCYMATRAALPSGLFLANQTGHFIGGPPWLQAILIGVSSEAVIRSRFYIKQTEAAGKAEELSRGMFDLLRFYQNIFLDAASAGLARKTKRFVSSKLPTGTFVDLYQAVSSNLDAWQDDPTRQEIQTKVSQLMKAFTDDTDVATRDERFRFKLGYLILSHVGQSGFDTLITPAKPGLPDGS